ncbi:MAG: alpha/beta fold hydrolase [Actinomycetales bacterium]
MTALNRRVATSVGELALADQGSGTPILMWPSVFSDHRLFDLVRADLGEDWRVIRIDGPGFGQSDAPATNVQPAQYAEAVVEVFDALGIARAVVAGCSWGGQVVAHLGVQAPERVIGVLMMNTPMAPSTGNHRAQVVGTRLLGSTRFWGRGVARAMFAPPFRTAHPEQVAAFVASFTTFDPVAATTTVRTTMTRFPGLQDVLPHLQTRTIIMMGECDTQYPVHAAMPIAARAPQAHIEIVPGCGHLAPLEAPEAVADALRSLAQH